MFYVNVMMFCEQMSNLPNGSAPVPSKPVRVNVNGRALVDKVLARYPEEFTGESRRSSKHVVTPY